MSGSNVEPIKVNESIPLSPASAVQKDQGPARKAQARFTEYTNSATKTGEQGTIGYKLFAAGRDIERDRRAIYIGSESKTSIEEAGLFSDKNTFQNDLDNERKYIFAQELIDALCSVHGEKFRSVIEFAIANLNQDAFGNKVQAELGAKLMHRGIQLRGNQHMVHIEVTEDGKVLLIEKGSYAEAMKFPEGTIIAKGEKIVSYQSVTEISLENDQFVATMRDIEVNTTEPKLRPCITEVVLEMSPAGAATAEREQNKAAAKPAREAVKEIERLQGELNQSSSEFSEQLEALKSKLKKPTKESVAEVNSAVIKMDVNTPKNSPAKAGIKRLRACSTPVLECYKPTQYQESQPNVSAKKDASISANLILKAVANNVQTAALMVLSSAGLLADTAVASVKNKVVLALSFFASTGSSGKAKPPVFGDEMVSAGEISGDLLPCRLM